MKSVLFSIDSAEIYARWIEQCGRVTSGGGHPILVENGRGNALVRLFRMNSRRKNSIAPLLSSRPRRRGYAESLLSDPQVLTIIRRTFPATSFRGYYYLSPFISLPLFTAFERRYVRVPFENCFVFWVHARKCSAPEGLPPSML